MARASTEPVPLGQRAAGALLAVAVFAAWSPSARGPAFWDDVALLASARALPSFVAAFSPLSFGLAASGRGAHFWRPLVTITLRAEDLVASALGVSPDPVHHLAQCAYHATAAWLTYRALSRWLAAESAGGAGGEPVRWLAWCGALVWGVIPPKAESVAWLAGRGDVLGWLALLVGTEAVRRSRTTATVALAGAAGTALALLCKETFVFAPVVIALVASDGEAERGPRRRLAQIAGSGAAVAAYLLLRATTIGVARGGGAALFEQLGVMDRALVPLESLGHAVTSLVAPWAPRLLRGPFGFRAPGVLAPDDVAAGVGLLTSLFGVVVAARVKRTRAALALVFAPLVPVLGLTPTGLEARMADRYLYVPSVGLVLLVLPAVGSRLPLRAAAPRRIAAAALTVVLGAAVQPRLRLFTEPRSLWELEANRPDAAASLIVLLARAQEDAGDLAAARDTHVRAAHRYAELGFAEGLPEVLAAARLQVALTGERHPPSLAAYLGALRCLIAGEPEGTGVPFPDGGGVGIPCQGPEGDELRASHGPLLRAELALWRARLGEPVREELESLGADGPRGELAATLARAWLALGELGPASALAARASPADRAALGAAIRATEGRDDAERRFVGGAFAPACLAARQRPAGATARWAPAACALAGGPPTGADPDAPTLARLRADPLARAALL